MAKRNNDQQRLFKEKLVPSDPGSDRLFKTEYDSGHAGPAECLGMTFPSDEERRRHFLEKLRAKLKDPEFRKIEGFPIGTDEDILALSDPPYYTACPNPFIADFIKHFGKPLRPEQAVQPGTVRRGCERGQERSDLQRPLLPHQGAAQSHHAVHPPLHRAVGCGL